MSKLIKILFPFLIVMPCCFLAPLMFSWGSTLFVKYYTIYDTVIYKVDIYNWALNYATSFASFTNLAYRFSSLTLNFDGVVNPFISIANILIACFNMLLLPISTVSCIIVVLMSFVGFPLNDANFLYVIFNQGSLLQIPYINYV